MQLPKKPRGVDFSVPKQEEAPEEPTLPEPSAEAPGHRLTLEEFEATVRRQAAHDHQALMALMTEEERVAYLRRRESLDGQR